jgi:hypothetical protein
MPRHVKCREIGFPVGPLAPVIHVSGGSRRAGEYHFAAGVIHQRELTWLLCVGCGDECDLRRCGFVADLIHQDPYLRGGQRYRQRAGDESKRVREEPDRIPLLEGSVRLYRRVMGKLPAVYVQYVQCWFELSGVRRTGATYPGAEDGCHISIKESVTALRGCGGLA